MKNFQESVSKKKLFQREILFVVSCHDQESMAVDEGAGFAVESLKVTPDCKPCSYLFKLSEAEHNVGNATIYYPTLKKLCIIDLQMERVPRNPEQIA